MVLFPISWVTPAGCGYGIMSPPLGFSSRQQPPRDCMVPEERAEWFHVGSLTHGESKGLEEGGIGGIDAALGLVDVEKVGIDAAHHDGIVKHCA